MTTAAASAALADYERIECLRWLDQEWHNRAPDLREYLLAAWAHPDLTEQRRDEAVALYADSRERERNLQAGIADYGTEYPELTCADAHEEAIREMRRRADEALHLLIHGERE